MDDRLHNLCDLFVSDLREGAGLHDYDGQIQDLSPSGVTSALARIGGGAHGRHRTTSASTPLEDPHDEAHLAAFERSAQVFFGDLELHRSNPLVHIGNLDLAGYDREYAPLVERQEAKRAHLAQWPDAVDMAVQSLDRVAAPVASALLGAARGLAAGIGGIGATEEVVAAATAAHGRLVAHLEGFAANGSPDISLGAAALAELMGSVEATTVDVDKLAEQADSERDRLTLILRENCAHIEPGTDAAEVVARLLADHPDADGIISEAQAQVDEVIAFTREHELVPYNDGECIVAPAPESRRWAMAMMAWAAPEEPDAASYYWVTPPELSWPAERIEDWLQIFSRTTLPLITLHEVSPGHFAHSRALRRAPSLVRRILVSPAFVEGWAHYVEELSVELGFRAGDPRVPVGMAIEALVRVTRLAAALGVHTGSMTVEDAAARFEADAFMTPAAALSEARRATFDPTYGRYTWGKLVIRDTREKARAAWGSGYSHTRFHAALLALGSPPIGLLDTAVERG
jgi:Bacterial protein of unknown function (DUF885)